MLKIQLKQVLQILQITGHLRSVSFFNINFLEADRKVIKTGNFNYTGITNYYNARIGTEKELISSRFSREISFKVGPKGLLLKAGQVICFNI